MAAPKGCNFSGIIFFLFKALPLLSNQSIFSQAVFIENFEQNIFNNLIIPWLTITNHIAGKNTFARNIS